MESAARTLGWSALGMVIVMLAAACSGDNAGRSVGCEALDALGVEIASFEELLVWPGITAAPLREATEDLVTAVENAAGAGDQAADLLASVKLVVEAVDGSVPPSLAQARPGEPAQMAAVFISVELEPLVQTHALLLEARC